MQQPKYSDSFILPQKTKLIIHARDNFAYINNKIYE